MRPHEMPTSHRATRLETDGRWRVRLRPAGLSSCGWMNGDHATVEHRETLEVEPFRIHLLPLFVDFRDHTHLRAPVEVGGHGCHNPNEPADLILNKISEFDVHGVSVLPL